MKLITVLMLALVLNGCVLTKVVTVPLRVGGAVVSVVPVVGNAADAVIDTTADAIDLLPWLGCVVVGLPTPFQATSRAVGTL